MTTGHAEFFARGARWALLATWAMGATATGRLIAQESPAAVAAPRWVFQEGDEHRYRLVQRLNAVQALAAGTEAKYGVSLTMDAIWKVLAAPGDGPAELEQTIRRIVLEVHGPGEQTMTYDSGEAAAPRGFAARVAPLLDAMVKHPIRLTMTGRGVVVDVAVPEALTELVQVAPGSKKLGDLSSGQAFENLLRQNAIVFPESEQLAPKQDWTEAAEVSLPALGRVKAAKTYQFLRDEQRDGMTAAVIDLQVALSLDQSAANPEKALATVELTQQESTGAVVFNRTAGRLESSQLKQHMEVQISAGDQEATQRIDQAVEVTWLEDFGDPPTATDVAEQ